MTIGLMESLLVCGEYDNLPIHGRLKSLPILMIVYVCDNPASRLCVCVCLCLRSLRVSGASCSAAAHCGRLQTGAIRRPALYAASTLTCPCLLLQTRSTPPSAVARSLS